MIEDISRPDIGNTPAKMIGIRDEMRTALDGITLDCLNVTSDDNIMSSVSVRGSFDPRDSWYNKIFMNSRWFMFSIVPAKGVRYYDSETETKVTVELDNSSHKISRKFRKGTTTPTKAIERIREWIEKETA